MLFRSPVKVKRKKSFNLSRKFPFYKSKENIVQELVESEREYRLWDRGEFSRFPFMLHTSFSQLHLSIRGGQTVAACSAPLPPLPTPHPPREDCSGVGLCLPVCLPAVAPVETVLLLTLNLLVPNKPSATDAQHVSLTGTTALKSSHQRVSTLIFWASVIERPGLTNNKGPGLMSTVPCVGGPGQVGNVLHQASITHLPPSLSLSCPSSH